MAAPFDPAVARILDGAGLNLRGTLPVHGPEGSGGYDARVPLAWRSERLLPGARSAVVVGNGGRAFHEAFHTSRESADRAPDPIDTFTRRILERVVSLLDQSGSTSRALFPWERYGGEYADFVALGRVSGMGRESRLALLLHPRYGPWMALRAVILTTLEIPPTSPLAGFDPCRRCSAPCAAVCHGGALDGGRFSVSACFQGRVQHAACRQRCDARRACVLGRDHAYLPLWEAHHMSASLATQRAAQAP